MRFVKSEGDKELKTQRFPKEAVFFWKKISFIVEIKQADSIKHDIQWIANR